MKFIVLIYTDPALLAAEPPEAVDEAMRQCFAHTDSLRVSGHFVGAQMLAAPACARTIRARAGRQFVSDGAFVESKEVLGGFNLIEALDIDEAQKVAEDFPWPRFGRIEVRPVRDLDEIRESVGMATGFALAHTANESEM